LLSSWGNVIEAIESVAVEIHICDRFKIFALFLLELLAVHAGTQPCSNLVHFLRLLLSTSTVGRCLGNDHTKGVDEAALWVVEIWQRDREIKDVDQLVGLVFDGFGKVYEVLVHHEGFLSVALAKTRETFQDLGDVGVVDAVYLHEVLEQHENDVRKEARLLAEVGVLEEIENLGRQALKVLVVLENLVHVQVAHLLAEALARLSQNVCLEASVHVVFDVDRILLADLHEHAHVVLVVGILLLVRVQQVLVFLEVADYFPVDSLILKRAVKHDKDLGRDSPVIEVRNVSLKDELKRANGTHLLLVLAV